MRLVKTGCLILSLMVVAAQAWAETALWVESAGVMIFTNRPAGALKQIERTGVRNEYVTAQLGLRTDSAVETPLSFDWTALAGVGGKAIARDSIAIYRGADILVDHGQKIDEVKDKPRARTYGAFPDALVPLTTRDGVNVANAVSLAKDRTLSFWVDILIPSGTPAGDYAGKITLRSGASDVAAIPVKVRVLNLDIPADSTIPSLFNLRVHPHVVANIDNYVAEVLRHRVQPTNYHYVDLVKDRRFGLAFLDRFNPGGKGYVNVYCSQTKALAGDEAKAFIENLKSITAHLKEKGLFEGSYIYMKDEPDANEIVGMIDVAALILDQAPEWKGKLLCTLNHEGTKLDQLLTHHVRALKVYGAWSMQVNPPGGREEWDKRRSDGQQIWFYVSNAQGWPFPTFDVNTVNLAWEPRVLGWAFWYEKAYGHLYWDLMFKPEYPLGKKFPPGDGELIYPGDFTLPGAPDFVLVKDLKGPVVSRRLKWQREGLEEWELLKMAEKKAGRAPVQAIVDKVYTCMGQRTWAPGAYNPAKPMWSYDEQAWDKAREQVIELLVTK